jgi:DMSO/TMAO reductase YedYZ molybdopterin-dependent catalytic subunit
VLEDYDGLPPVILCYKLNGEFLNAERGGPVRMVVPEAYGFKNVKWLSHVVLTNLPHANDTYANGNNDLDSPMKTFSAVLATPSEVKAGEPIAVSGYAQVGISGLSKVQVWMRSSAEEQPPGDPYFTKAPWRDAELLSRPEHWGGLPEGKIPAATQGFTDAGEPKSWPMRFAKIHWAATLPGLPAGDYELRSRTVDDKGYGQPMPRPFRKSGHSAIESVTIRVKA